MRELEKRYRNVMRRINPLTLLNLPDAVIAVLKETTDLKTKVTMLEYIADGLKKENST